LLTAYSLQLTAYSLQLTAYSLQRIILDNPEVLTVFIIFHYQKKYNVCLTIFDNQEMLIYKKNPAKAGFFIKLNTKILLLDT